MKHNKAIGVLKKIGAAFCAALALFSTVVLLLLFFFQNTLLKESFYLSACNETYLGELEGYIVKHLSEELARYEEDGDVQERLARECVDRQTVEECTKEYLKGLSRAFLQGETLQKVPYPVEKLEPFRQYVIGVSQQEGYEVEEKTLGELLVGLSDLITADINCFNFRLMGFSSLSIIGMVHEKVLGNPAVAAPLGLSVFIPLSVAVLSCVGLFFLTGQNNPLRKIYNAVTFVWAGATLLFFPALLLTVYDLPSRLAITASPVKSLLDSLLTAWFNGLLVPAALVFGVTTVALIVLIVLQMRQDAKAMGEAPVLKEREENALPREAEGQEKNEEDKTQSRDGGDDFPYTDSM